MLRHTLAMIVAFATALSVGVSPTSAQTVVYVDDDAWPGGGGWSWATAYDSLSTALAAAESGDQIWVAAGTYVGNFTLALEVELYGGFAGTETELTQRDWTANPTILDGDRTGSVVTSPFGATETTRIDGFTITNGSASSGGGLYLYSSSPTIANNLITGSDADSGGGLYLRESSPTIENNTITANSADGGGGLYLYSSSPTIANNAITGNFGVYSGGGLILDSSSPTIPNNTITNNFASMGGGLYLDWYSSPTIANNTITGNSASDFGGGLFLRDSSPTIANNTITGNGASWGGALILNSSSPTIADNTIAGNSANVDGGGLWLYSSCPTIANNTITGNSASDLGGGLCLDHSSPTVANNTITGNSADAGGGVYLSSRSSPTIANNTITRNSAHEDGGGLYLSLSSPTIANTIVAFNSSGIYLDEYPGTPTLRYNCVYGNTAYDYSGLTEAAGTDGNISCDPLFVQNPDPGADGEWGTGDDDYGNLRLLSGSPCVDAADNAAVPPNVTSDLDGHPRFVDDPRTVDTGNGTPPIVDMGAYEFRPGDCGHDGDVDHPDYVDFEGCLSGPGGELPGECECFDLDGSGHVDLADFAVFQLTFTGG